MNSFAGDVAQPGRPAGGDLLGFQVLAQVTETETQRLAPAIRTGSAARLGPQLAAAAALLAAALLAALAPPRNELLLRHRRRSFLGVNSTRPGTSIVVVPEHSRVIDGWRYGDGLLRADTTHTKNLGSSLRVASPHVLCALSLSLSLRIRYLNESQEQKVVSEKL